jgi:hypothetical protein
LPRTAQTPRVNFQSDEPEEATLPRADMGTATPVLPYESPKLVELGSVTELTLGCNKAYGGSDGFTFQQQPISCTSA